MPDFNQVSPLNAMENSAFAFDPDNAVGSLMSAIGPQIMASQKFMNQAMQRYTGQYDKFSEMSNSPLVNPDAYRYAAMAKAGSEMPINATSDQALAAVAGAKVGADRDLAQMDYQRQQYLMQLNQQALVNGMTHLTNLSAMGKLMTPYRTVKLPDGSVGVVSNVTGQVSNQVPNDWSKEMNELWGKVYSETYKTALANNNTPDAARAVATQQANKTVTEHRTAIALTPNVWNSGLTNTGNRGAGVQPDATSTAKPAASQTQDQQIQKLRAGIELDLMQGNSDGMTQKLAQLRELLKTKPQLNPAGIGLTADIKATSPDGTTTLNMKGVNPLDAANDLANLPPQEAAKVQAMLPAATVTPSVSSPVLGTDITRGAPYIGPAQAAQQKDEKAAIGKGLGEFKTGVDTAADAATQGNLALQEIANDYQANKMQTGKFAEWRQLLGELANELPASLRGKFQASIDQAADMQGLSKVAFDLTAAQSKSLSSRVTQQEVAMISKVNPNINLLPGGLQKVMAYRWMQNQLALDKQVSMNNWMDKHDGSVDGFSTYWNQQQNKILKQKQTAPGGVTPADINQPPIPQSPMQPGAKVQGWPDPVDFARANPKAGIKDPVTGHTWLPRGKQWYNTTTGELH